MEHEEEEDSDHKAQMSVHSHIHSVVSIMNEPNELIAQSHDTILAVPQSIDATFDKSHSRRAKSVGQDRSASSSAVLTSMSSSSTIVTAE